MSDLFISYSRKDKEFVHRLFDALIARQRDVWVDWEDIPPTADWRAEIYSAIESAQNFLFVLSPDSVASQVCGEELAHAIQTNKRLIPIFCRDVDSKSVNPELGKLNWIYFRATDDFDRAVESLNTALDTDLAWVKAHTRLLTRAVEWENKKRDDSLVLRGRDLREAEEAQAKSAAKEPKLTPLQSEYILASRKSENRRQRIIRGAVTIGFIAMSILAIFAFIQRNQAIAERNLAQSRELAAATLGNLESDRELGLLLALEALRIMPTFEAEDALRQALQASYNRIDLDGFGGSAVQALFSPDAKSVLTVSNDGTTQLWSASTGSLISTFKKSVSFPPPVFLPDSKHIVLSDAGNTARLVEVNTGKEIATLGGHTRPLTEIAASPDGKWIATSSRDNSAQLWDATTGRKIWTLAAFAGAAEHFFDARATFSPNSKLIVTCCGSDDNGRTYKLILWDVTSGKKLAEAPYHLGSAATSGAVGWTFSPNGIRVLEVNQDGTARIREVLMGQIISTLQGMKNRSIGLFNSNGTWVSTLEPGTSYGDAELWDTNTGNKISVLPGHSNTGIGSSKLGGVKKVFYNSAGTRIVTLSGDNTAELWDPITGRQIALLHFVDNVVLSPDGSSLLSYGSGIQLWDMGTGKLLQTFSSSSSPGQLALFSPNGDRVLTINATYKVTSLWETGIEVAVMRGHTDPIYNTEFDTSGKRIVTASADGTARVWEVPTGR